MISIKYIDPREYMKLVAAGKVAGTMEIVDIVDGEIDGKAVLMMFAKADKEKIAMPLSRDLARNLWRELVDYPDLRAKIAAFFEEGKGEQ